MLRNYTATDEAWQNKALNAFNAKWVEYMSYFFYGQRSTGQAYKVTHLTMAFNLYQIQYLSRQIKNQLHMSPYHLKFTITSGNLLTATLKTSLSVKKNTPSCPYGFTQESGVKLTFIDAKSKAATL
jgi:hypothetical protein